MLEITQIQSFYPENIHAFKRNLLREYLQYKILEAIFTSPFSNSLSFMGGTCIHIIHSNPRFSEDLDFDNLDISQNSFITLTHSIKRYLELEGYSVELKNIFKGAFHAQLRFKNILFESGLSGHTEEKLMIQIDTEPQYFHYSPEKIILNKFDVFTRINVVPADILLAQKFYCILNRKRPIGRDFFDTIFLMSKTKANKDYLKQKLGINNQKDLKARLLSKCEELNFNLLARDVEPFIFRKNDAEKILMFYDYLKGAL